MTSWSTAATHKTYVSQEGGPSQGDASRRDYGYVAAFKGPAGQPHRGDRRRPRHRPDAGRRGLASPERAEGAGQGRAAPPTASRRSTRPQGIGRSSLGGRLVLAAPRIQANPWTSQPTRASRRAERSGLASLTGPRAALSIPPNARCPRRPRAPSAKALSADWQPPAARRPGRAGGREGTMFRTHDLAMAGAVAALGCALACGPARAQQDENPTTPGAIPNSGNLPGQHGAAAALRPAGPAVPPAATAAIPATPVWGPAPVRRARL